MHFLLYSKSRRHVAVTMNKTQLVMKRKDTIKKSWVPLESQEKGEGLGHSSLFLGPPFVHIFLVHHPVNRDDRHLLALAMASDFTVALQYSQREQLFFCYGSNSTPYSN
jgi:hypothetical protein